MKLRVFTFLILTCHLCLSNPVTHTITFNVTANVNCSVGDTLKFYGTFSGDYVVAVNLETVINPTIVTSPFYLGSHIVVATDTLFTISEITQGPRSGSITVQMATGYAVQMPADEFKVGPNPVRNVLTIIAVQPARFYLFNGLGVPLTVLYLEIGKNTIDVSGLPPGSYYLRGEEMTFKIVKEQ